MPEPPPTPEAVRALCALAGLALPEEDLPALAEALAAHRAALAALRTRTADESDPPAFDPRWE